MPGTDPNALYGYTNAGIPADFTTNLLGLGYQAQPFATQEQDFQNQASFQQLLKRIMDMQLGPQGGAFGGNPMNMPFNMRNLFSGAANVFKDPNYGIIGANDFFGGGYKYGDLPNNRTPAWEFWDQARKGYPSVPAPSPISASNTVQGGGGSGGTTHGTNVGSFDVALPGGGSMRVNASDANAARQNAGVGSDADVKVFRSPYTY